MSKINKVLSIVFLGIAVFLVVASFFKGAYLFYEAIAYGTLAVCLRDTSKKEEGLDK